MTLSLSYLATVAVVTLVVATVWWLTMRVLNSVFNK